MQLCHAINAISQNGRHFLQFLRVCPAHRPSYFDIRKFAIQYYAKLARAKFEYLIRFCHLEIGRQFAAPWIEASPIISSRGTWMIRATWESLTSEWSAEICLSQLTILFYHVTGCRFRAWTGRCWFEWLSSFTEKIEPDTAITWIVVPLFSWRSQNSRDNFCFGDVSGS
jgi:hypothetical protein